MSRFIETDRDSELIRYLPAKEDYDFPTIDEYTSDASINENFLNKVDKVYGEYLLSAYDGLDKEDASRISKGEFNKEMLSILSELLVSYYYMIPWEKEAEVYGGIDSAFDYFLQTTFPAISEHILSKTQERTTTC